MTKNFVFHVYCYFTNIAIHNLVNRLSFSRELPSKFAPRYVYLKYIADIAMKENSN